eukprot:5764841-Pyramimonas_sp.AAC.2
MITSQRTPRGRSCDAQAMRCKRPPSARSAHEAARAAARRNLGRHAQRKGRPQGGTGNHVTKSRPLRLAPAGPSASGTWGYQRERRGPDDIADRPRKPPRCRPSGGWGKGGGAERTTERATASRLQEAFLPPTPPETSDD